MNLLAKIKTPLVVALTFSAFICMASDSTNGQRIKLSPEGLERKAAHEFLFQKFAKRVASMFRYFLIRGENLDRIGGLKLLPYSPDGTMHVSTREPRIYRVQMPSLPMPSADMKPMVVVGKSEGKAVITEVAFNSQGRLKTIFDDLPYRNLGAEHPREKVDVQIDLEHELSIEGHVDLERSKFFRFYARPGMPHPSLEQWAADHNFLPGRQINKLQNSLAKGFSRRQPKLKEDKSRPGHANLDFFKKYRMRLQNWLRHILATSLSTPVGLRRSTK